MKKPEFLKKILPKKQRSKKRLILIIVNILAVLLIGYLELKRFSTLFSYDAIVFFWVRQCIFTGVSLVLYYLSIIADAFDRAYRDFENDEEQNNKNDE